MNETDQIWFVCDRATQQKRNNQPLNLTEAVELYKEDPQSSYLDTVKGGGSSNWLSYPDDEITEYAHKLLTNNA